MSQLAPNGREAGDFTADALGVGESHTYVEDGKTYLRFTFTMGATWVLMKGKSNFYIWMNRLNGTVLKKCVGMVNVMIDQSTDNYFIADVTFNPNVKAYIDAEIDAIEAQLGDGSPKYFDTAANILAQTEDKGLAVATDTGAVYYWDNDTEAYVASGLQYTNLSAYYTKTQADALLANKADKSTAITHTGNQLQDYSGNNIYPEIANNSVAPEKTDFITKLDNNLFDTSDILTTYNCSLSNGVITTNNLNFNYTFCLNCSSSGIASGAPLQAGTYYLSICGKWYKFKVQKLSAGTYNGEPFNAGSYVSPSDLTEV
jgi:hypothetical protein